MSQTTWKQVVLDVADAYREASDTTEKIPVSSLADKVRAGAGTPYAGDNPLLLGQEGFTFPAKTLLKEELRIENAVTGEDLTETYTAQKDSVEDLMRMVQRKVSDHRGSGQYVWTKSYLDNAGQIYLTVEDSTTISVTSDYVDITKLTAQDFIGLTGTFKTSGYKYEFYGTVILFEIAGSKYVCEYTYDVSNGIITTSRSFTWLSAMVGDYSSPYIDSALYIDEYLVSDDISAYPLDGRKQGDYSWYQLYNNDAKIVTGEFTVTTANCSSISFNHNIGRRPKLIKIEPVGKGFSEGLGGNYLAVFGLLYDASLSIDTFELVSYGVSRSEGVLPKISAHNLYDGYHNLKITNYDVTLDLAEQPDVYSYYAWVSGITYRYTVVG